jgi:hypothetical protein
MLHLSSEGGRETALTDEAREQVFGAIMEQLKRGTIREYKRIFCFDHEVLAKDYELKSGILRVGEGPGTLNRSLAEHCRLMLATKGVPYSWPPSFCDNSSGCMVRTRPA